jgi:hypothetical protein
MAIVYSNTDDGSVTSALHSSWANARDNTGSTSGTVAVASNDSASFVQVDKASGRRGATLYKVSRSFMYFDTSGITGTVSAATIKIKGAYYNDASVIAVKSTAFGGDGGTALVRGDIDAITGFSTGSSLAGSATVYGPQILTSSWSTSGYNDFTGTSDLRSDMETQNVVIICFMDYTNDYLNVEQGSNATLRSGGKYTEMGGTGSDPYIEYTVSASGYTHDVNGVAAASIGKVNYVTTASIGKIISVD